MTDPEITADQLLSRYQLAFETPLSTDGLRPDDVDILRALYEARLRRASEQIAERGRSVAAANPEEAAKAISFSLVIPLLHHSDHVWSKDEVRQLPVWLRKPDLMAQLEETALRLQRPLAAWSFADFASDHTSGANETSDGTVDYLNKTVDRLLRDSRFDEAVACLQCLLSLSDRVEGRGDPSAVRFRLAEVLADTGKPGDAVGVLEPFLQIEGLGGKGGTFGKAVMLSLKYQYEAENYEGLFALSDEYRGNELVGAYRAQVLYITWVAARRNDRAHLAKSVREDFLGDYPGHLLAADIYFAQAMEALARSDYEEAQRLLEYVSYRYPDSRLITRVEEIQKRLAEQEGGGGP